MAVEVAENMAVAPVILVQGAHDICSYEFVGFQTGPLAFLQNALNLLNQTGEHHIHLEVANIDGDQVRAALYRRSSARQ